jgi:hypothetical protein
LQLLFKQNADGERPDNEAHNTKPRTNRVPHVLAPCPSSTNGDSEFIEDPMKKKLGE